MDDVLRRLEKLAQEQQSTVSRNQILEAGGDRYWISEHLRAGYLTKIAPATYRTWGVRPALQTRAMAAVLSAKAPAVVSHKAAAYLHELEGIRGIPAFVDVTVPRHQRPRQRPGVRFHESTNMDLLATVERNLIPVTGVARTTWTAAGSQRTPSGFSTAPSTSA